jgi:hypothetical protein
VIEYNHNTGEHPKRKGVNNMAQQLSNGKWNPVVFCDGFVNMTELVNDEYRLVECDTQEEAEQKEKEYREFWSK